METTLCSSFVCTLSALFPPLPHTKLRIPPLTTGNTPIFHLDGAYGYRCFRYGAQAFLWTPDVVRPLVRKQQDNEG
jgi:hypothetical protein